jgi:3D (Asp-Asp-Asp) domain-containing protein
LIGRSPFRLSHVLAVSVLSAGFAFAGFFTHPSAALAASAKTQAASVHRAVTFESTGTATEHATDAATVGAFLLERNIVAGPHDYLAPSADTPLSDGITIVYRAAVPVTIATAHDSVSVLSSAEDVGALLEEQHVRLGSQDQVQPSLSDPVPTNGTVRIARVVTWDRSERRAIAPQTIHRIDFALSPGSSRIIAAGSTGQRDVMVRFTQRDNGKIQRTILATHVTVKAHPRIVAEGVDEYDAFARFEARGIEKTSYIAQSAMQMVATAYTASCSGCSGVTASGRHAGHGIVAVDPSVIPLGTRLYIPGYGFAVAGDTGGAIRGSRIDLGFNSERDAMLFGRRPVTVYRLK